MTTKTQASTKYYIYIDECGDQNLENYNPEFGTLPNFRG